MHDLRVQEQRSPPVTSEQWHHLHVPWYVMSRQGPRMTSISKWSGEPDYVISNCLQLQSRATGVRVYVTTTGVTTCDAEQWHLLDFKCDCEFCLWLARGEPNSTKKEWRHPCEAVMDSRVRKTPSARQQCWPESFCESGKFLQKAHYWLKNIRIFWDMSGYYTKYPDNIQSVRMNWKVFGWSKKCRDELESFQMM